LYDCKYSLTCGSGGVHENIKNCRFFVQYLINLQESFFDEVSSKLTVKGSHFPPKVLKCGHSKILTHPKMVEVEELGSYLYRNELQHEKIN
jgi:hypothetical protein